jgi:ferric-dicitrate binding protein FerR (iron transport regulator)
MSTMETNCRQVHGIWLEEATGRPLTASEQSAVERHLERCLDCRREAEAVAQVAFDGTPGPAPALDDLAHRRWVDQVIERADAATGSGERALAENQGQGARIYRIGFWAAAAAVAVVAVGAVLWLTFGQGEPVTEQAPTVAQPSPTALEGELLLAAGDVRIDGAPIASVVGVATDTEMTIGKGRAVIDLGTGITLLAAAQSTLRVAALDTQSIEVQLERGRVLAEVDPARQGPPFAVATAGGRVVVTGTAFAVDAAEDQVEVRVFRGSVRLEEPEAAARKVRVGEIAVLGKAGVSRLNEAEKTTAGGMLRTLDMLASSGAAQMDIQSLPAGADVVLDGVVLGKTPLEASIRAGHRSLELYMEGYEAVRELLELVPEGRASRVFDLVGTETPVTDVGGEAGAAADRPPRPVKVATAIAEEPPPQLTAADLLARAQSFRVARDWKSAVAAYQELAKQFPKSAEARSSLVSIGDIQLAHLGQPGRALKSFDSYLARTRKGAVAQEAAFGRAQALRALGRTSEEIRALETFLAEFPSAIQAPRAKKRLDELKQP